MVKCHHRRQPQSQPNVNIFQPRFLQTISKFHTNETVKLKRNQQRNIFTHFTTFPKWHFIFSVPWKQQRYARINSNSIVNVYFAAAALAHNNLQRQQTFSFIHYRSSSFSCVKTRLYYEKRFSIHSANRLTRRAHKMGKICS